MKTEQRPGPASARALGSPQPQPGEARKDPPGTQRSLAARTLRLDF